MLQNFYFTKDAKNSNAHYWIIPRSVVEELSQSPEMVLDVIRGRTVGEITHTLHKRLIRHKQAVSLGQYVNNGEAGLLFFSMNATTSLEQIQQHLALLDSYNITDSDMMNWINTNNSNFHRRQYEQHTTDLDLAQAEAYELEDVFKIKLIRDLLTRAGQLDLLSSECVTSLLLILDQVDYEYELNYYDDQGMYKGNNNNDYWSATRTGIREYKNSIDYRLTVYYRVPMLLQQMPDRQAIFIDLFRSVVDDRCYLRIDELIKILHDCYSSDLWSEFRSIIAKRAVEWQAIKQQQLILDQAAKQVRDAQLLLTVARRQIEHMISTQASVGELNITN